MKESKAKQTKNIEKARGVDSQDWPSNKGCHKSTKAEGSALDRTAAETFYGTSQTSPN